MPSLGLFFLLLGLLLRFSYGQDNVTSSFDEAILPGNETSADNATDFAADGIPTGTCPTSKGKVRCGDTLTSDTTLQRSLRCPNDMPQEAALIVDGVVLDCAGKAIVGNMFSANGARGVKLMRGATLKNCIVGGFANGVYLGTGNNVVQDVLSTANRESGFRVNGPRDNTLVRVKAIFNLGDGILINGDGNNVIKKAELVSNRKDGLYLNGLGFTTATEIVASNNRFDGVHIEANGDTVVSQLTAFGNNLDGVYIHGNGTNVIQDSSIYSNRGNGILIDAGKADVECLRCLVSSNGDDGIDFSFGINNGALLVSESQVVDNLEDGITLQGRGTAVIKATTVIVNGDNGIHVQAKKRLTARMFDVESQFNALDNFLAEPTESKVRFEDSYFCNPDKKTNFDIASEADLTWLGTKPICKRRSPDTPVKCLDQCDKDGTASVCA